MEEAWISSTFIFTDISDRRFEAGHSDLGCCISGSVELVLQLMDAKLLVGDYVSLILPPRTVSILLIFFIQPKVEGLEELHNRASTHFPEKKVQT